ncbi:hypothetical protein [Streptomyces sp. AC602_WCS936]|uniref:hypothetical protein n=1 Tax=Streptomyces sp. AC602_WCS936 TaxID=2823685 RepID=UPI001C2575E4|nr:hypothetical protein [Streptomyces sp. AC602_WCS936]
MGVVAVLGGTLVLVVGVVAIVLLGRRALDRARPEDVPVVTEQVMRVLRDSRPALQRPLAPGATSVVQDQAAVEGGNAR